MKLNLLCSKFTRKEKKEKREKKEKKALIPLPRSPLYTAAPAPAADLVAALQSAAP